MNMSTPLVRRLRARHLELLQILGEVSTVHAAARQMNLSQPATTRMIREVEEMFGGALFDRSPRGIAPNRSGASLIGRAAILMRELATIEQEVELVRQGQQGLLRVGALTGNLNATFAVAQLLKQAPAVQVSIREGQINLLIAALLGGELDCVVGPITDEELRNPRIDELRLERLVEDSMAVVASPKSAWCRRRRIKWGDLSGERWILPPPESVLRRAFMRVYLELGMSPPEHRVEALSPLTTRSLISLGTVELGLLRMAHAREEAKLGGLKVLSMASEPKLPPLALLARRAPSLRPMLLDLFIKLLMDSSGAIDGA
ncbi:LysR family transcriptional regulator [Achromobacter anxifer]